MALRAACSGISNTGIHTHLPGRGPMAGQSPTPVQEGHREPSKGISPSGLPPMSDRSAGITPREGLAFEERSCVGPGSRWQAGTTSLCRGTSRSVLSCMTGCQDSKGWIRTSAGGETAGRGKRAITCLLSVEPGLLRSGGCGGGSGGTAVGSTRGHRRLGGYGGRRPLRLC